MKKMLSKLSALALLLGVAVGLSSCGQLVTVPSAHFAAVKTNTGWEKTETGEYKLYEPSTFRMPWRPLTPPQLVLIETSHFSQAETMPLFVPKDKLQMNFDVRGTLSVNKGNVPLLLENITPAPYDSGVLGGGNKFIITADKIYEIYGAQMLRNIVRAELSKYSIEEIMTQREQVDATLFNLVSLSFKERNIPLEVIQFGLADIELPESIKASHAVAQEKKIKLEQIATEAAIALAEAERALEVARKQQEIDLLEAETQVLVEEKLSASVSDAFVTQRTLRIWEQLAGNSNKSMFFMPADAFTKPELLLGAQMKAFSEK